jgi:hypothetical protein
MNSRRRKTPHFLAALASSLMLVASLGGTASAAWAPTGLSDADLSAALASMSPQEREVRSSSFHSDRYVIVSYAASVQGFDRATGRPLGPSRQLELGETAPTALAASISYLTLTIAVAWDREAPAYTWAITDYFQWNGWPPNGNDGKDQLATAWANGLALVSDYAYGHRSDGTFNTMAPNDMTPNVGTSWEFNECRPSCAFWSDLTSYGYLLASIRESSIHNQYTNVVFKYFHTWQGVNYSIGFSSGGPSISISPSSGQSSSVVYASFVN